MLIGKLASSTGASRDALRFYEERGLIRSRRHANGYRDYEEETVELVGLIQMAQRLGFSLKEIGAELPALWHAAEPDAAIVALLEEKIDMVDARLAELTALRGVLAARMNAICPLRRESSAPAEVRRATLRLANSPA